MERAEPAIVQSPALTWLWGARVQRLDAPEADLFSLTLFHEKQRLSLLLWVGAARRGVGASRERPKGQPASGYVQRLRGLVENARLESAHSLCEPADTDAAVALELVFARGPHRTRLVADFHPKTPGLLLLDAQGRVAASSDARVLRERLTDRSQPYTPEPGRGVRIPRDEASLFAAGERMLGAAAQATDADARRQLRSAAAAALKRATRKADAIRADMARASDAPRLRREADALLCNLHAVPRGASVVQLLDPSVDPPAQLEIRLDPSRDPQQNAQQRYERARKLERGAVIAQARLAPVEATCAALRAFLERVEREPLEALLAEAAALGLRSEARLAPQKRAGPRPRVPYRTFVGHDARLILVGKGAADNDALTLTVARPHDYWLHARGVHGAHVIVPQERGAQPSPELLLDAAHLAAHFSDVRGEPTAEIQHTERRYLRKPKGAAPGAVNVDREKVLLLRVEPSRLARLLASERT